MSAAAQAETNAHGAVAGVLVIVAAVFIDTKLKIDDPVGASAVHGVNGAWGIVALGLFANGTYGQGLNGVAYGVTGLLYGDAGQLVASVIGILANVLSKPGARSHLDPPPGRVAEVRFAARARRVTGPRSPAPSRSA